MATTEHVEPPAVDQPTCIVELLVENVKRILVARVRPKGEVIIVGGRSSQGKSSLIDAIDMALRGAKAIPKDPVRHGAEQGRIVVDLGTIVVERTFDSDRKSKLVVRDKSGKALSSPQTILDRLLGKVSFDPMEFANLSAREQVDKLKQVAGLDFSELDQQREKLADERRLLNLRIKELDAQLTATADDPDAPKQEVPVTALVEELQHRHTVNAGNDKTLARLTDANTAIEQARVEFTRLRGEAMDLERKLTLKREEVAASEAMGKQLLEQRDKLAELVATLQDEDALEIQARIDTAEDDNRRARARLERAALTAKSEQLTLDSSGRDDMIADIDARKSKLLAEAKFPVPGLSFTAEGPIYLGAIWTNMGTNEQIRVSMAMGLALNPGMPIVMIKHGSLLDDDGLALVAAMAARHEPPAQVWVERVGTQGPISVVIEDGTVKEDRGAVDLEPPL